MQRVGLAVLVLAVWIGGATAPASAADPTDLLSQSNVALDGPAKRALAGASVASAGDVNGDGLGDAIVGAYLAHRPDKPFAGVAYVIFGSRERRRIDLRHLGDDGFEILGEDRNVYAGTSVAGGGDVNGDGLDDVVVGAPRTGVNGPLAGSAFVVFGKRDTFAVDLGELSVAGFRIDARSDGWAGTAVAIAPDMNGDGRDEPVVGLSRPGGYGGRIVAAVVFGRPGGGGVNLESLEGAGFELRGEYPFGEIALAGAGDVNGDGRGDVVIGARRPSFSAPPEGRATVVYGKPTSDPVDTESPGTDGFLIRGSREDGVGESVAGAGDANGDGLDDVLVGAPRTRGPHGFDAGAAYVVYGSHAPVEVSLDALGDAGYSVRGARGGDGVLTAGDQLGESVAPAGDLNADGRDDVLLGAPYARGNGGTGAAFAVFSPAAPTAIDLGESGAPAARLASRVPGEEAGQAVAGGGDLDGDGRPDAIVGAPLASGRHGAAAGAAYVVSIPGEPSIGSGRKPRAALTPLRQAAELPLTDGERWVVRHSPGKMWVYDARRRRGRDVTTNDDCSPSDTASGLVLVNCGLTSTSLARPRAWVLDIRRGTFQPASGGYDGDSDGGVFGWFEIGRHWIVGGLDCYHCTVVYVNWHTGERINGGADIDETVCRDLDSRELDEIPCPPYNRVKDTEGRVRLRGGYARPLILKSPGRRVVLSRCKSRCNSPVLRDGRVTWLESETTLRGYVVRSGRRVTWPVPRFWEPRVGDGGFPTVLRIGPNVLVSVGHGPVGGWPGPRRIYRADW